MLEKNAYHIPREIKDVNILSLINIYANSLLKMILRQSLDQSNLDLNIYFL